MPSFSNSELEHEVLTHHRATLFGLLDSLYVAFVPSMQILAMATGFIRILSLIAIAWSVGDYDDAISSIMIADVVALIVLVIAGAICIIKSNTYLS